MATILVKMTDKQFGKMIKSFNSTWNRFNAELTAKYGQSAKNELGCVRNSFSPSEKIPTKVTVYSSFSFGMKTIIGQEDTPQYLIDSLTALINAQKNLEMAECKKKRKKFA